MALVVVEKVLRWRMVETTSDLLYIAAGRGEPVTRLNSGHRPACHPIYDDTSKGALVAAKSDISCCRPSS